MKIGIVTTWFERGGAYVSRQYADVLRAAGHEVLVFARGGETYAKGDPNWDFDWVYWGRRSLFCDRSWVDLADFKKWLIANRIEMVLFNEQHTWGPILMCREMGIKTVAYIDYYTEQMVPGFANYDALICNTERHYSAFEWHPGVMFVPWGTDTKLFSPQKKDISLVEEGCVSFFHSAGMSPSRKGTDFLIRAFEKVSGPAKLIIHSQIELEKKIPDLKDVVEKLKASGRLECIVGTVPAPGLYHLGDVYVYPARLDGIGLTVCEALSCGLPAIVPDNGPMNEFVPSEDVGARIAIERFVSRYDGYYWPQCWVNEVDLTEKIQGYVDDPDRVISSKRAARQYAQVHRDWSKNTSGLGAALENATSCSKKVPVPVEPVASRVARNAHLRIRMALGLLLRKIGMLKFGR